MPNLLGAVHSALWSAFFNYRSLQSYNGVLWTMEKELLGSWFLFGWLALAGGFRFRPLFYVAAAIILCGLGLHWLNAFVAGSCLADVIVNGRTFWVRLSRRWRSLLVAIIKSKAFFGVGLMLLWFMAGVSNRGSYYVVLATVVTAFVLVSPLAGRILAAPPAMFLGKISFGIYLVHTPLLNAVSFPVYRTVRPFASEMKSALAASAAVALLSLLGGWLLWFLVDRHAVTISRRIGLLLGTDSLWHESDRPHRRFSKVD